MWTIVASLHHMIIPYKSHDRNIKMINGMTYPQFISFSLISSTHQLTTITKCESSPNFLIIFFVPKCDKERSLHFFVPLQNKCFHLNFSVKFSSKAEKLRIGSTDEFKWLNHEFTNWNAPFSFCQQFSQSLLVKLDQVFDSNRIFEMDDDSIIKLWFDSIGISRTVSVGSNASPMTWGYWIVANATKYNHQY